MSVSCQDRGRSESIPQIGPALRPALLALCLARIGESNSDRPLQQKSIKLYGTGLKEMNFALRDSVRVQTDELLVAGKLMAGYEVPQSRTANGLDSLRELLNKIDITQGEFEPLALKVDGRQRSKEPRV
ncbi:MAG: hypothetical protein Q9177_002591 [Variospora cf. flavescens]